MVNVFMDYILFQIENELYFYIDFTLIFHLQLFNFVKCDFYLMSDYPITTEVKNQWITYRQNLRDITTSINTSDLVIVEVNGELEVGGFTWPTRPQ